MDRMLLSIIIPTYINEERSPDRLLLTIKGYMEQSTKVGYEIIVVDDGSEIDVKALLSIYKLDNLRVVRKENAGLASSLNMGVNFARAQYVLLGIDDNVPARDVVERVLNKLEDNNAKDMLIGNEYNLSCAFDLKHIIDPELENKMDFEEYKKKFPMVSQKFPCITEEDIKYRMNELFSFAKPTGNYIQFENFLRDPTKKEYQWICWRPGIVVINKDMYKQIGGYDEAFDPSNWYSDIEFGYRAQKNEMNLIYDSELRFLHLNHPKFFTDGSEEVRCYKYMVWKHKDIKIATIPFLWSANKFDKFSEMNDRLDELFVCYLKENYHEC